jgi:hypothetical protein
MKIIKTGKNHPTLTGKDTRDRVTLARSVSHQYPPLILPNYWQKGAHGGKTAQNTGKADKAQSVMQIRLQSTSGLTDESGCR